MGFLPPTQPKKKSAFSGPLPSPGPRKTKLALDEFGDNYDLEGRDYLLDYDTDDFDTVAGESMMSAEDEPEEVKKWKKGRKKFEEKNEKERKKAAKKIMSWLQREVAGGVMECLDQIMGEVRQKASHMREEEYETKR